MRSQRSSQTAKNFEKAQVGDKTELLQDKTDFLKLALLRACSSHLWPITWGTGSQGQLGYGPARWPQETSATRSRRASLGEVKRPILLPSRNMRNWSLQHLGNEHKSRCVWLCPQLRCLKNGRDRFGPMAHVKFKAYFPCLKLISRMAPANNGIAARARSYHLRSVIVGFHGKPVNRLMMN